MHSRQIYVRLDELVSWGFFALQNHNGSQFTFVQVSKSCAARLRHDLFWRIPKRLKFFQHPLHLVVLWNVLWMEFTYQQKPPIRSCSDLSHGDTDDLDAPSNCFSYDHFMIHQIAK